MAKRGKNPNTRSGGQPAEFKFRGIVADPSGNREQRRAARKLRVIEPGPVPAAEPDLAVPACPHCGRTSHGFICYELLLANREMEI